jgi:hypothetical protein
MRAVAETAARKSHALGSAGFMGGDSAEHDWIDIVLTPSFYEDISVICWNFLLQKYRINRSESAHGLLLCRPIYKNDFGPHSPIC